VTRAADLAGLAREVGIELSSWQIEVLEHYFAPPAAVDLSTVVRARRNGLGTLSRACQTITDETAAWADREPFSIDAWQARRAAGRRPCHLEMNGARIVFPSLAPWLTRNADLTERSPDA
jgi:hypothetical protein